MSLNCSDNNNTQKDFWNLKFKKNDFAEVWAFGTLRIVLHFDNVTMSRTLSYFQKVQTYKSVYLVKLHVL